MKPRNFKGRKMARQLRAYRRLFKDGVLVKQSHEAFVLHHTLPVGYVAAPHDIRHRHGAAGWAEYNAWR